MAHGIISSGYSYPDGSTSSYSGRVTKIISDAYSLHTTTGDAVIQIGNDLFGIKSDTSVLGTDLTGMGSPLAKNFNLTRLLFPGETGTLLEARRFSDGVGIAHFSSNNVWAWGRTTFLTGGSDSHVPSLLLTNVTKVFDLDRTANSTKNLGGNLYYRKTDGYCYAVGSNTYGQLGIGTTNNTTISTQLTSLGTNATIFSSDLVAYATSSSGQVYACGNNTSNCLGIGAGATKIATWTSAGSNFGGADGSPIVGLACSNYYTTDMASYFYTFTTALLKANQNLYVVGVGPVGDSVTTAGQVLTTPYLASNAATGIWGCGPTTMFSMYTTILGTTFSLGAYNTDYRLGHTASGSLVFDNLSGVYGLPLNTNTSMAPLGLGQASFATDTAYLDYYHVVYLKSTLAFKSVSLNGETGSTYEGANAPAAFNVDLDMTFLPPETISIGRFSRYDFLALTSDGRVYTWGKNEGGLINSGQNTNSSPYPMQKWDLCMMDGSL